MKEEQTKRQIYEEAMSELEDYGEMHGSHCNIFIEEECTCDMHGLKTLLKDSMDNVDKYWVTFATEHRKYCTPEGNRAITRIMGRTRRSSL